VWTSAGTVPIEDIRIGDLVLSQNPETGELAFKPVLQTSVRPSEQLVRIAVISRQEEFLEGSGGHPLWVSGDAWVLLRQIQSGAILHGIDGPAQVSFAEEGSVAETHNLVVDDFHTYVVGEAKVLCHDNTPRQPTSALVPGLLAH
jgi:hypothetical protein